MQCADCVGNVWVLWVAGPGGRAQTPLVSEEKTMSKRIRRLVSALLALTLVAAAFIFYIWLAPLPRHSVNRSVVVHVERTPDNVAEGRRLAQLMCEGCHFDPATGAFSGKPVTDLPAAFGRF